jgi:hypothetical protein
MQPILYRIEHTRNRTSSATFEGDGVLIRLAGRLSTREEERHIASLLKRMAQRFADHRASQVIDPLPPFSTQTAPSPSLLQMEPR